MSPLALMDAAVGDVEVGADAGGGDGGPPLLPLLVGRVAGQSLLRQLRLTDPVLFRLLPPMVMPPRGNAAAVVDRARQRDAGKLPGCRCCWCRRPRRWVGPKR